MFFEGLQVNEEIVEVSSTETVEVRVEDIVDKMLKVGGRNGKAQ